MPETKEKRKKELCDPWEAAPLASRLQECRFMLYVHGLLPEAQNERLKLRIQTYVAKREKDGNGKKKE